MQVLVICSVYLVQTGTGLTVKPSPGTMHPNRNIHKGKLTSAPSFSQYLLQQIEANGKKSLKKSVGCPVKLCVDFGSSGAKFFDCDPQPPLKFGGAKLYHGSGAFGRMAAKSQAQVNADLTAYMNDKGWSCPSDPPLHICGGTAGNRFKRLLNVDSGGWTKFNTALQQFVTIDSGKECETLPGTTEANVEWVLSDHSDIFVGIGGASLQLRVPKNVACPSLSGTYDGGVGANSDSDYCIRDSSSGGQRWSFLADKIMNATDKHKVGGMDEAVGQLWILAKASGSANQIPAFITNTVMADTMWVKMLNVLHANTTSGVSCEYFPSGTSITLLSNANMGRNDLLRDLAPHTPAPTPPPPPPPPPPSSGGKGFGKRPSKGFGKRPAKAEQNAPSPRNFMEGNTEEPTVPELFRKFKVNTSASMDLASDATALSRLTLQSFLNLARTSQSPTDVLLLVINECNEARAMDNGLSGDDLTNFWSTYSVDHVGFLCAALMFHMAWTFTFAGYYVNAGTADLACFQHNFDRLVHAGTVDGDWMTGALVNGGY